MLVAEASMTRLALVLALVLGFAGCNAQIPNHVSEDEYRLYAEWVKGRFSKEAPKKLYVGTRTFAFDPAKQAGCERTIERVIPQEFTRQLHALGEAEYRLDIVDQENAKLHIPWKYTAIDDWRLISESPQEAYDYLQFSRVAFDRSHTKAFFAVSDSCGGLCGSGAAVYSYKENNSWVFKNGGCSWIY